MACLVRSITFDPATHAYLTPYLAGLQAHCIRNDFMIGPFLPPLSNEKLLQWWKDRIAETKAGARIIILLLGEPAPAAEADLDRRSELAGVVMLSLPSSETSPFSARVESLLVDPKYRRRGAAKELMLAVHAQATLRGKTLLMAEMESGAVATKVFKNFGYLEAGRVPNHSICATGALKELIFYYKELNG